MGCDRCITRFLTDILLLSHQLGNFASSKATLALMNTFTSQVLALLAAESGEVRVTTFAAVLLVLTLILLLAVSFYTLQLVNNLRRQIAQMPLPAQLPHVAAQSTQVPVGVASAPVSVDGASLPPQLFAVVAAAIHVSLARPARIVTVTPESTELQEALAWSHAGRLHLHDHRRV